MVWTPEFKYRVLFNASKAYVRQIKTGVNYELLQPVYSLNLVNDIFEPEMKGYYHYSMNCNKAYAVHRLVRTLCTYTNFHSCFGLKIYTQCQ